MQPTAKKPSDKKRPPIQNPFEEPFRILEEAGNQLSSTQSTIQQNQQPESPPRIDQDAIKRREQRHYQAFQTELAEIRKIQARRERKRQELRVQEEGDRQRRVQAGEGKPLEEPMTKKAKGILGGVGAMIGVKRKQRSTELAKTPSN